MTDTVMGRRERKKAATRQALADAALELFLERGYDKVGVKDIADAADVSTTTLFKHFAGKEALVFDEDAANEAVLVGAVRNRAPGQSIPAALHQVILHLRSDAEPDDPRVIAFLELVNSTQALREYAHKMWMRHQVAVAHAIAEEVGAPADDPRCAALALFALEAPSLLEGRDGDTQEVLGGAFELLERGWSGLFGPDA